MKPYKRTPELSCMVKYDKVVIKRAAVGLENDSFGVSLLPNTMKVLVWRYK